MKKKKLLIASTINMLYHGTTTKHLQSILDNGLLVSNSRTTRLQNRNKDGRTHSSFRRVSKDISPMFGIFLGTKSTAYSYAMDYARNVRNTYPMIVQVRHKYSNHSNLSDDIVSSIVHYIAEENLKAENFEEAFINTFKRITLHTLTLKDITPFIDELEDLLLATKFNFENVSAVLSKSNLAQKIQYRSPLVDRYNIKIPLVSRLNEVRYTKDIKFNGDTRIVKIFLPKTKGLFSEDIPIYPNNPYNLRNTEQIKNFLDANLAN